MSWAGAGVEVGRLEWWRVAEAGGGGGGGDGGGGRIVDDGAEAVQRWNLEYPFPYSRWVKPQN